MYSPRTLEQSLSLLLAVIAFAAPAIADAAASDERRVERELRAHLGFFADDLLEGRGAGTRGHELAARYVASHFARIGLRPAGDNGTFLQSVQLRSAQGDLEASRLVVHVANGGGDRALTAINDMFARPSVLQENVELRAPAVFVGFGVHAPTFGYDDFGDVDLRGKIAVVLAGSPDRLPATARAHHSRRRNEELERRGAVAVVSVITPRENQRTPWAMRINGSRFAAMRLVDPDGALVDDYPGVRISAAVNLSAAEVLFQGAARTAKEVFAASERGEPQAFPLGIELTLGARAKTAEQRSPNVVALLPGTDPALAGEPVVVTTHLDHLGIGPAIGGDAIYNGAYDNGIGCSQLLLLAERLAAGPAPRRPILFAAVTGEEKGLLGSLHLARHPPAGVTRYAANLNVDMALFLAPVRDVIARGSEHSSLGAVMARVAREVGFTVSPDPMPDEVIFVRSDQYSFVRQGVPALYVVPGTRPLDASVDLPALEKTFRRERYHQPSDDLAQTIDWPSAVAFSDLLTALVPAIANEAAAPTWLPGDFFGETFGKK